MPSPRRHLLLAAAVAGAGLLLACAAQDPPRAVATLGSCRPAQAEPPPPALSARELRLADYLSRRYFIDREATERVVAAAYDAADQVGLDPLLLLAVAAVESSFNPLAESVSGAKGLMQIIPRYHREKLRLAGGDKALFDPQANILLGARILQEYVRRTGTLEAGLQFYNGAFSDETARYSRKVMAERARLEAAVRGADREREASAGGAAS